VVFTTDSSNVHEVKISRVYNDYVQNEKKKEMENVFPNDIKLYTFLTITIIINKKQIESKATQCANT
jgi:hypothetical protein